jgi:hypothetical protein
MTNRQENRLNMYLSFKEFQDSYRAITDALPNYAANSSMFENTIPQIQALAEQQKTSTKGFTVLKNTYREALIVTTADYSRKLGAYAQFTDNAVLAQQIKFSERKLRLSTDTAVRDYAQIVYDRAQETLADLEVYGISASSQTELQNAIALYNDSIGKPAANRTEKGKITRQMENLFAIAEIALANMDVAVEIIRLPQRDFYLSYKKARRIIKTAGSLALKGLVVDASSNKPIKGVSLSFSLVNNGGSANGAAIVKKTYVKGGFNIKSLGAGVYTVAVKKVGYGDELATVAVAVGEMAVLKIGLLRN